MDDLIRRSDAIRAIEEEYKGDDIWRLFKKPLMDIPAVEPKQAWIPCEERLPEATGFYICTVNRELFDVRTMKFEMFAEGGYRWLLMNGLEVFPSFVLAWMPLSEPYMKGADDE